MELYHFTSEYQLALIKQENAITKGRIEAGGKLYDGVWLTPVKSLFQQGWKHNSHARGAIIIRIKVHVASHDHRLVSWPVLAKKLGMNDREFNTKNLQNGGNDSLYYVFLGRLSCSCVVEARRIDRFDDPEGPDLMESELMPERIWSPRPRKKIWREEPTTIQEKTYPLREEIED